MQESQASPVLSFLPLILMFAIFYFLLIRPQQKKEKDRLKLIEGLKKGDRVVTSSGIVGTVLGTREDLVVLKVGDGETKIEFLKSAINGLRQEKE